MFPIGQTDALSWLPSRSNYNGRKIMRNQEERQKKGYLIAKALHQFMWASILASLASQIAMTTDAIVVSQFIGPEAISAINLTMPVVIFFNFLMMLFGMGGSVLVARCRRCVLLRAAADFQSSGGQFHHQRYTCHQYVVTPLYAHHASGHHSDNSLYDYHQLYQD